MIKKCRCPGICECPTDLYVKLEDIINKYSDDNMRTLISPTKESSLLSERELTKNLLVAGEHISALKQERESTPSSLVRVHPPYEPRQLSSYKKDDEYKTTSITTSTTTYKSKVIDKFQPPAELKIPDNISIVSTSSPSGLYSENLVNLFINEKQRFIILFSFDSTIDLFRLSGKLVKRSSFSNKDEEETGYVIPPRLCSPKELKNEIKQMLIWIGIAPMAAFRQFRKMCSEQCLMKFRTEKGFLIVQNEQHEELMKSIEVKTTEHYYGSGYPPVNNKHNMGSAYLDSDWG